MSSGFFHRLALSIVALGALWLRTAEISRRPMHADEANQAVKTGDLIEHGHYAFDPRDHHGPTLYYAAVPLAWLRGERTLAALTETTVRLVPAIAGTLSVLLLAALVFNGWPGPGNRISADNTARSITEPPPPETKTHWRALLAATFLALSPPAVYYSRYFIQETLLVTFTLALLVCAHRWWLSGSLRWVIGAGIALGLMQATKASTPLFVGAAVVAALAARAPRPAASRPGLHVGLALMVAGAVAALFYSSFGQNPLGIRDALSVYGPAWHRASEGAGHEKPWWYYLQLFTWQRQGGLSSQQLLFSALAMVGAGLAFFQPGKFWRGTACYTAIVAVALSITPYKTPWHAVHLVPGLAVMAAFAIAAAPQAWLGSCVALVALIAQFSQTRLVAFIRPADARNPYDHVHSAPDVLKYRPLVEAALASAPGGVVRVIGSEYWPLPWYLRGLPRIGYWSVPPDNCDGVLIIATDAQAASVREKLHGRYTENYLGLRPGVMTVIFTRQP